VGNKGGPVEIVVEVKAGVADVAGMEELLDDELNRTGTTIEFSPSSFFFDFTNCLRASNPLKWRATSVARIILVTSFFISRD
jgi:hypothetical protein